MTRRFIRAVLGDQRFDQLRDSYNRFRTHPRIAIAMGRAAATSALRQIDPARPSTWEFVGFSQNGEDGIIDYLCERLVKPNRYFIEIGAADGLENNTSWLAMGRRYGGLMIDGDPSKVAYAERTFKRLNWALDFASILVNRRTVDDVVRLALLPNPDVFSLDIDSVDYYVALELLARGLRPKICIVEYNAVFGPDRSVTVEYKEDFNRHREHPTGYYYGASVTAMRRLFEQHGYRFVTVERNGINAFFIDPGEFKASFVNQLEGVPYSENLLHRRESRGTWRDQFDKIQHLPLVEIGAPARGVERAS
jgi:hypothetical protein